MDWVLELAENANTYTPLAPADERIVTDRFVLWMGRGGRARLATSPSGFASSRRRSTRCGRRFTSHAACERTHRVQLGGRLACDSGRSRRPAARARARRRPADGARNRDGPDASLRHRARPDVEVRRAESRRGLPRVRADRRGRLRAARPDGAAAARRRSQQRRLPRLVDGKPVARASGSFGEHGVTLFGGATLPEARGRGAYRALVAARWDDAVARGTPILVTQAGPDVAPDPGSARLPGSLRDPDPARRVRSLAADAAEWLREGLGEGGLRDPGGSRAGGRRRRPGERRPHRAGARDPARTSSRTSSATSGTQARREPPRRRRRLLARAPGGGDQPRGHHPRRRRPAGERARGPLRAARVTKGARRRCGDVWVAVRASLRGVLEQVTLADLARGELPESVRALAADPDAWAPH